MSKVSRREFLSGAVGAVGAGLAVALGAAVLDKDAEPSPETVEIEKIIEQTVEVGVEQTVEVEKLVEVEVEKEVVRVAGEPSWSPPDLSGEEYLIWGLEYDPHIEAYYRLADRFEEYTGAKATVEPQGWPIQDKVITGMAAGIVPDVCCIVGMYLPILVRQDAVVPLDELVYDAIGCDKESWFGPVALQAFQNYGKTWGVPAEGSCTSGVTNVLLDLVHEYGVEKLWPPLNGENGFRGFEDMWALADVLQEEDAAGNVTRWGLSTEGWYPAHLFGIMRTLGQDWWDPESRTFHLDSDEAIEAMNLLAYRPIWELGIETHLAETSTESLLVGNVAVCSGNVTMPGTGQTMTEGEVVNIDTCIYPSAIPGRDALFVGEGGWGFFVPEQAKNQDVGLEFMKFLTTYEGNKTYCSIYGGIVSAVNGVNNDDDLFPADTLVGDAMRRSGLAQKRTVFYGHDYGVPSEMTGAVAAVTEKVRIGEVTYQEACIEAQDLLEEMLVRWDSGA